MRSRFIGLSCLGCCVLSSFAFAADVRADFTLGRYVPDDSWMFMNFVDNPEVHWLEDEWNEFFGALEASGIERDIVSLSLSLVDETQRADVEAQINKWTGLFKAVQWSELFGKEVAFAERVPNHGPGFSGYDCIVLTRSSNECAEKNLNAILDILKEVDALSDHVHFGNRVVHDVTVWSMSFGKPLQTNIPFSLQLFRKGDVLGLVTGKHTSDQVVGLLAGQKGAAPIVASARFKEALGQVPLAEDGIVYFDFKAYLRDMQRMFGSITPSTAAAGEPANGQEKKEAKEALGIAAKLIQLVNVMDYTMVSVETDGRRQLTHSVARILPDKKNAPLVRAFLDRKPFDRFDQFIPANANGFSINDFIDLEKLYKIAMEFVEAEVPEAREPLAHWKAFLTKHDIDLQRDLFSWLSGEMISVSMPPAVVTPMSGEDSVFMIRVKDGALARKKIDGAIDWSLAQLRSLGPQFQALMVKPADVEADGFREVNHPMFAMFMRPVFGVKDEWLIIGTSSAAINKCLAVSSGKAPSIATNERFKTEGLTPKGPVAGLSFTDTTNLGQKIAAVFGGMGFAGAMLTGVIPDQGEESRKMKGVLQSVLSMATKLAPVFQKLDFYSSEAEMTTYDGALTIRSEKVVTYKPASAKSASERQAETSLKK